MQQLAGGVEIIYIYMGVGGGGYLNVLCNSWQAELKLILYIYI